MIRHKIMEGEEIKESTIVLSLRKTEMVLLFPGKENDKKKKKTNFGEEIGIQSCTGKVGDIQVDLSIKQLNT